MSPYDVVIAVFKDHRETDAAVRKLIDGGFDMRNISVIDRGYHTEESIVGFYSLSDRMKTWGKYGAFWGGFGGLVLGGMFATISIFGSAVLLGQLALLIVTAIEGAVVVGMLSALGAALFSAGGPKEGVLRYQAAIKANGFVVMAHGAVDELARAKSVLAVYKPSRLESLEERIAGDHFGAAGN